MLDACNACIEKGRRLQLQHSRAVNHGTVVAFSIRRPFRFFFVSLHGVHAQHRHSGAAGLQQVLLSAAGIAGKIFASPSHKQFFFITLFFWSGEQRKKPKDRRVLVHPKENLVLVMRFLGL